MCTRERERDIIVGKNSFYYLSDAFLHNSLITEKKNVFLFIEMSLIIEDMLKLTCDAV